MNLYIELKKNHNQLLIRFGNLFEYQKVLLMRHILIALSSYTNKKFLIYINGLEVTIDHFLSEITSQNYQYSREKKGLLFVKELANIYLLTDNEADMDTVATYFGAFNEGFIKIQVLDSPHMIDIQHVSPEQLDAYVSKKCILEFLVEPDGDFLTLTKFDQQVNLEYICFSIKNICNE